VLLECGRTRWKLKPALAAFFAMVKRIRVRFDHFLRACLFYRLSLCPVERVPPASCCGVI
jgi:hypothetical protein